jgi:signal transduction histidine kinase
MKSQLKGTEHGRGVSALEIFSEISNLLLLSKQARQSGSEEAFMYAFQAVEKANSHNIYVLAAEAYFELAASELKLNNSYNNALAFGQKALALVKDDEHPFLKANILKIIGICNHYNANYTLALANYRAALKQIQDQQITTREEIDLKAGLQYNIFQIQKFISFDTEKIDFLLDTIKLYEACDNKSGQASCYRILGEYCAEVTGNQQQAMQHFERARVLFDSYGNGVSAAMCDMHIGLTLCQMGQLEEGFHLIEHGFATVEHQGSKIQLAHAYSFKATAYKLRKDYTAAIESFIMAEELLIVCKSNLDLNALYQSFADVLAESGDYKSAYDYRLKYESVKDQLMNFDKSTAINDATTAFSFMLSNEETSSLKKKNEEIEEYTRQLELMNNELKQLAFVASHDLREPLRMINNYSKLLYKEMQPALTEEDKQYVTLIGQSARRMYEMIQDMMSLSQKPKIEQQQSLDLNEVIHDIELMLAAVIEHKNAKLVYANLPEIKGERTLFYQLFQNLISNALKYNNKPDPLVEVKYVYADNKHFFTVSDNGIGIPPADREKVFYIFARLHSSEEYTGNGIGLAVCKKVIERMRGKIWIEDSYLGGAAFKFYIPDKQSIGDE